MLELPGLTLQAVHLDPDLFTVDFHGNLIKVMDGATQRTRWTQSGCIHIHQPQIETEIELSYPSTIEHGEIHDNVYIHRDIIRLPLHSSGYVGLEFYIYNLSSPLMVHGGEIEVQLHSDAKYVEHID